jgi:hypothetical protein
MKRSLLWLSAAALAAALLMAGSASAITSDTVQQKAVVEGKADDNVWPKPVSEFLRGNYLQLADVVLTQRSSDIASTVIRWATKSAFSHAAMIFTSERFDSGISGTFVIEAGTSGVDITNFSDYAESKGAFVAIKRLNKVWFNPQRQSRARGVLLDKIKDTYDYWTIWRIARNIWFGVQSKINSREKTVESYHKRDWEPPNEYICSGLVQIGFVQSIVESIEKSELPPETLLDVVFTKAAASRLPEKGNWKYLGAEDGRNTAVLFQDVLNDELYSVTPEDLAQSDKLEWLYLIKDGKVYSLPL